MADYVEHHRRFGSFDLLDDVVEFLLRCFGKFSRTADEIEYETKRACRKLAGEIAFTHHEKWDGSGYPRGLAAEEIPLSGRIMAIADVYDALTSKRHYKSPFSHEKAKGIIEEGRGVFFDPTVLDAFLTIEKSINTVAADIRDEEYT